jgi:hypothetical protein
MNNLKVVRVSPVGSIIRGKFFSKPLYYQQCELTLENGQVVCFQARSLRKRDLPCTIDSFMRSIYHPQTRTLSTPLF